MKKTSYFGNIRQGLFFLVIHLWGLLCYAQQLDTAADPWKKHLDDYNNKRITATQYLFKIDTLIQNKMYEPDLKEKLETYRLLIWTDKKQKNRKRYYFECLSWNAGVNEQVGLALFYYMKKLKEEGITDSNAIKASIAEQKIGWLSYTIDHKQAIDIFENVQENFEKTPQMILQGTARKYSGTYYSSYLFQIINSYIKEKDTAKVKYIEKLAERIHQSLVNSPDKYPGEQIPSELCMLQVKHLKYRFLGDMPAAENALLMAIRIDTTTTDTSNVANRYLRINTLYYLVEFYLDYMNDPAKASFYLELLKKISAAEVKEGIIWYRRNVVYFSAKLAILKKDYKAANAFFESYISMTDSLNQLAKADLADNLLAQAELSDAQENIIQLNKEKNKRNLVMLIGSFLVTLSAIGFYAYLKKKNRMAKTGIEMLNNAFQIQIAEMEERNREAVQAEQKRLSRELHDDLAGGLAGIRANLETEIRQIDNTQLREKLSQISRQIDTAYQITRDKSHKWYSMTNEEVSSFSDKLKVLLENGLPSGRFESEVTVDKDAISKLDLDTRIEFLYVIREALTNIIKHANADKIGVLIYEDLPGVILQITDNGKGFDTKAKKAGIGLRSIRERAASIGGTMIVNSGQQGTEITITIPKAA